MSDYYFLTDKNVLFFGGNLYLMLNQGHVLLLFTGNVAFPGGKRMPGETEQETSLRESQEEINLRLSDVRHVIGLLPPRVSRTGILVTPVLAIIRPDFKPEIDPNEVELAFELPLKRFLSSEGYHGVRMTNSFGVDFTLPFFDDDIDEHRVTTFGLTAMYCIEIATGIFKQLPDFDFLNQSVLGASLDSLSPDAPFKNLVTYLHERYHSHRASKL